MLVIVAALLLVLALPGLTPAADKPSLAEATKGTKQYQGLLKVYAKKNKLYAEIQKSQLNKDFLVLISLAQGVGEGYLLGGISWGFGDDWLWQFRQVDENNMHLVRVNTRFKAASGSPEAQAVKQAYGDSVLFNLRIVTNTPSGFLVDLTPVFMSDLPQISQVLSGFRFAQDRSTFGDIKAFDQNVELQVNATYASAGTREFDTVPDSRGVTMVIHYSISQLPGNGYKPRLADDRVGYFLTAVKDFSVKGPEERFQRYINRWDLQKADPSAELSPPKQPIVFWLENTVPYKYRKPIREGILEWNKAFEKAGFLNAIEVRQQPPGADWDPEDVKYNTFRWITSGAGFAMGPSRVNPRTGQILDADIIFDADFIQFWKQDYETFTPQSIANLTGGPLTLEEYRQQQADMPSWMRRSSDCRCELAHGFGPQLAFGSAVLATRFGAAKAKPMEEKLIMQGLKEVTMHEVGHTLGLRHNFKASTFLSLKELNEPEKTAQVGLTASVMDYAPANMVPNGTKQGDYYSQTIGPYDYWAIEYGYKPFKSNEETTKLAKIAERCAEDGLAYATDEDTRGIDSDPLSNRFDLGKDPLEYAKQQAKLVSQLWPNVIERTVEDGQGYQKARRAFLILLSTQGRALFMAARNIGGLYVNRDHKGDPNARDPFVVVDAKKQRESLQLLSDQLFSDKPFQFPPELYNKLAVSRWSHWGINSADRLDLPVHEYIARWQERVLDQVLSSLTLRRLHDSELKVPLDRDCLTTAELLDELTGSIFSELTTLKEGQFTARKPAISSLRRNLQRLYLSKLADLALGKTSAPEDCRTVAFLKLTELQGQLKDLATNKKLKLDTYTKAHAVESIELIGKVLDARLTVSRP